MSNFEQSRTRLPLRFLTLNGLDFRLSLPECWQ